VSNFNLNDYETVKQRKLRFYKDHPDGRITVKIINSDLEEKAVVQAYVYLNASDQEKNLPRGVGNALEIRDKALQKNKFGKEYESVNFSSWLENAEESAIGRCLDNAGYASNARCSQEEIKKASRISTIFKKNTAETRDYRPSFGKYKGSDLSKIPENELRDYVAFIKRSASEKNQELKGDVLEFIEQVESLTNLGQIKF